MCVGVSQESGTDAEYIGEYGDPSTVYPFGMDPAWHIADNEVRRLFLPCRRNDAALLSFPGGPRLSR